MVSSLFNPGECGVCHRDRRVTVVASPFGPVSHAICEECLQRPAEPLGTFEYLYDDCAHGNPDVLDKSIKNWYTWIDGKYVHWDNYVYRRKSDVPKV